MADHSLTAKQQAFVREYLIDLNATQAAIRAGYSEKTSGKIGFENLQKPEIASAIQVAKTARMERTEVSADWVLARLVENVDRSMQAEPVYDHEGNQTGEYRYHGAVANKALELLGKHCGLFAERLEHTGKDGGPIETRELTDLTEAELEERARRAHNRIAGLVGHTKNGNGAGNGA